MYLNVDKKKLTANKVYIHDVHIYNGQSFYTQQQILKVLRQMVRASMGAEDSPESKFNLFISNGYVPYTGIFTKYLHHYNYQHLQRIIYGQYDQQIPCTLAK